jgi:hypothetical protein
MNLGALDATVHGSLAQEYGVRGYPTIKYFAPGSSGNLASGLFFLIMPFKDHKWDLSYTWLPTGLTVLLLQVFKLSLARMQI